MTTHGDPALAQVAVILGSDSDLPVMQRCLDQLDALEVAYDVIVASAHRTPRRVEEYVKKCEAANVRVFVCAAGGAAHLAGVVAAHTTLPVLGVPLAVPPLDGMDALLAMVQMPPGIPVGTLAVGTFGATNAGIFAAQILSLTDADLRQRVHDARLAMRGKVLAKNAAMRKQLGLPEETS